MRNNNVPALRLEGFSGEWERVSVDEVATRHDNERIPVTQKDRIPGPTPYYGANGIQDYVRGFTHEGPLVLVAEDGANDLSNYPVQYVTGYAWVNNHAHVLRCKPKTADDYFLKVALSHSDIKSLLVGGGRAKLNAAQLMQISFCKPTLEEQQVIGAIFTNLDSAINQHTLKHKALQQSKTALMQRMFPQEGQTVPELRLEGFSGEWEETTLGELGSTYGGLSGKKKEDFGHGDAMYVTYKDIFSRALITDTSQCERVEVDTSQNEVHYGDIFFTTSSEIPEEVGLSAVWLIDKPNVYLNSFCFGFRPTGGFDLHFLGHVLRSPAVRSQFLLLAQGISRFNISKTKAANISLYAPPTSEEQQAIGAVFTNLDQLIAAEAQYITSLKQAKTALLQRMFI